MSDPLIRDGLAREAARTVFDRPVVLRAGAGTGKTAALVSRVIAWICGPGWDASCEVLGQAFPDQVAARTLSRVVAITFTEAAAAEMAERVAEALSDLSEGKTVTGLPEGSLAEGARARAELLLAAVDQMEVRTIHAWCRRLLVQFPIEAGVHPSFDLDTTEEVVSAVVRDATESILTQMLDGPQASELLQFFDIEGERGPSDIERAVLQLLRDSVPLEELEGGLWSQDVIDALLLRTRNAITAVLNLVHDPLEGVTAAKNAQKLRAGLRVFRDGLEPGVSLEAAQAQLEDVLPSTLIQHLEKAWTNGRMGKAESEALCHVASQLEGRARSLVASLQCVAVLDQAGHVLACRLLRPILGNAQSTLRTKGTMMFSDLLARAVDLLKNRSVAARVRAGIDQLLVDEFQDTDPRQCDLVRAVALEGEVSARPGLFIVGDPKQSIYGWRSADLRAYESFVEEVIAAGGEEHGLIQNFRSTAGILEEVDRCMVGLLKPEPGVQPAHESLIAARGPGAAHPQVEHWVSWDWVDGAFVTEPGTERARQIEAVAVAQDICRLRRAGVPLSEVGLLFRSVSAMHIYQAALRDHGIAYEVTRDKNYFRRREVIEATAMLRAVLDPSDTLALVGFLRSSMVNLPDAALIPLFTGGFPKQWMSLKADSLPAVFSLIDEAAAVTSSLTAEVSGLEALSGWSSHLKGVVEHVQQLRESFSKRRLDAWLDEVRSVLLPDLVGAVAYQGTYRVANLERLFRTLIDRMGRSHGDAHAVLHSLRQAVREQRNEEEGRPSGARETVSMMTIHKSKGLAFTHTYIVDMHHTSGGAGDKHPTRYAPGLGLELMGFKPPMYDLIASREKAVERAEMSRLLYVAMTRARDRLVCTGLWPSALKGLGQPRHHLDLFGERRPMMPHPIELVNELPDGEAALDAGGIRWVFPARRDVITDEAVESMLERPVRGVITSVESIEAAAERAARPWSMGPSAASGEHHGPQVRHEGAALSRIEATQVGSAIHLLLEWAAAGRPDFSAERVDVALRLVTEGQDLSSAGKRRALELAGRLDGGKLAGLLQQVEVLGVEVPFMMPPSEGGPVAAWTGSIDLLYRCPQNGEIVVADYKTDRLGGRSLDEVAAMHAPQGHLYAEAVSRGLGLEQRPRFEVWLVEADDCVVVE